MRTWAGKECSGIDVDRETATFKDYTFASAKTDWPATWRNWMRKAKPGAGGLTKYEKNMSRLRAPDSAEPATNFLLTGTTR